MKKIIALLLACMMLTGLSLSVCAEDSPEANPVEPPTEVVKPTSPQTGESNILVYSTMTMCLCAGMVVVSLRKTK